MQYLKSRPCTLIPDSRNLYDLYSITRALGRSYVTARIFRARPRRADYSRLLTRGRDSLSFVRHGIELKQHVRREGVLSTIYYPSYFTGITSTLFH